MMVRMKRNLLPRKDFNEWYLLVVLNPTTTIAHWIYGLMIFKNNLLLLLTPKFNNDTAT